MLYSLYITFGYILFDDWSYNKNTGPEIRRLIVIGNPEKGFASLGEMFQDPGDLFDDNIEVY